MIAPVSRNVSCDAWFYIIDLDDTITARIIHSNDRSRFLTLRAMYYQSYVHGSVWDGQRTLARFSLEMPMRVDAAVISLGLLEMFSNHSEAASRCICGTHA